MCDKSHFGQCFPASDIIINFFFIMSACVIVVALFKKLYIRWPAHGSAILFHRHIVIVPRVRFGVHCMLIIHSLPCQNFILCAALQKLKKMDASCPERSFFSNALSPITILFSSNEEKYRTMRGNVRKKENIWCYTSME